MSLPNGGKVRLSVDETRLISLDSAHPLFFPQNALFLLPFTADGARYLDPTRLICPGEGWKREVAPWWQLIQGRDNTTSPQPRRSSTVAGYRTRLNLPGDQPHMQYMEPLSMDERTFNT